jgi:heme O synthase-like polyprenyltransferase
VGAAGVRGGFTDPERWGVRSTKNEFLCFTNSTVPASYCIYCFFKKFFDILSHLNGFFLLSSFIKVWLTNVMPPPPLLGKCNSFLEIFIFSNFYFLAIFIFSDLPHLIRFSSLPKLPKFKGCF